MSLKDVVFIQTVLPHYRFALWQELKRRFGSSFFLYCGSEFFFPDIKTVAFSHESIVLVKNIYLFGRRILYQVGVVVPALKAKYAVVENNPRIFNTWVVLLGRKLIGKSTVLFGHAFSMTGKDNYLRALLRACAGVVLVYTEREKDRLLDKCKQKRVIAAGNALYSKAVMAAVGSSASRQNFIFVGRFVPEKKIELLIEAFYLARAALPSETRLLIVGGGPLEQAIKQKVRELGLNESVDFYGQVSNVESLKQLYASAVASVSPGYVGLSIVQSFGFGIPMLIACDEPHAPEIEAANEGKNCLFFNSDSATALSEAMQKLMADRSEWLGKSVDIVEYCRQRYSLEAMSDRFVEALESTRQKQDDL
ncbi:MAG: glycosyltransferase family 4 protein [Candidatus Obscuribacterales bacterium]|nr:glycosyltransferase family 4 protein [Candidatus Obscuribacterales bacterium]